MTTIENVISISSAKCNLNAKLIRDQRHEPGTTQIFEIIGFLLSENIQCFLNNSLTDSKFTGDLTEIN